MLNIIRKHAQSWIIKLFFGILVLVFVLEFGYLRGAEKTNSNQEGVIAKVNGEKISYQEYKKSYDNLLQYYKNIYKKEIPLNVLKNLNLEKNALEGLIVRNLLIHTAQKEGIEVSDKELLIKIKEIMGIKGEEKFDREKYLRILQSNRIEPKKFEEDALAELMVKKLEKLIKDKVILNQKESVAAYSEKNNTVNTEYYAFAPLSLIKDKLEVKDEEIKDYYSRFKEQFKTQEKVKVEYIILEPSLYEKSLEIGEEKIREYYEEHLPGFSIPQKIKAAHILIKVPGETKDAKIEEETKKKAENILKELKKGGDFSVLAQKYSEDIGTASKGGDLGYFSRGQMVKPFEDAAYALKKGEISPVVKSVFGFHIIKLDDIKEGAVKSLNEAKKEIVSLLKTEEAKVKTKKEAKKLYKKITIGKSDFKTEIKALSVELRTTDFFSREEKYSLITDQVFMDNAFSVKTGEFSEPFQLPQGFCILRPLEKKEAVVKPLGEVTGQIREKILKEKQEKEIGLKTEVIAKGIKEKKDIKELIPGTKIAFTETGFLKKGESIPVIGNNHDFTQMAFSLSVNEMGLVKSGENYYLVKVIAKKDFDSVKYKEEEKKFTEDFINERKNNIYQVFLEELKKNAQIEILDPKLKKDIVI